MPIAVTGSTGELGGRVARRLAALRMRQRLIVRDSDRAPHLPNAEIALAASYSDTDGMRAALTGVNTVFLVSGRESSDRLRHHMDAVDAAVSAGVERIVYLSFLSAAADATFTLARQHFHTEQHLRSTGVRFTVLRPSLYLDSLPRRVGDDGVIRGPAGDGRAAFVARDDIADVAAIVLTTGNHDGKIYDLTGREAISLDETANQLSRVTGRSISFHDETVQEAWDSRARYGAPEFEVEGWITSYLAIAAGEMGPPAETVQKLTGHPALTFAEYLERYPESYRHLMI